MGNLSPLSSKVSEDALSVFVDEVLTKGSKRLSHNELFRLHFANYIKSGIWLDKLAAYESTAIDVDDCGSLSSKRRDRRKDPMFSYVGYKHQQKKVLDQESTRTGRMSDGGTSSRKSVCSVSTIGENPTLSSLNSNVLLAVATQDAGNIHRSSSHDSQKKIDEFHESYLNLYEDSIFDSVHLMMITMAILFPLFLKSSEYKRFLRGEQSAAVTAATAAAVATNCVHQETVDGFDDASHFSLSSRSLVSSSSQEEEDGEYGLLDLYNHLHHHHHFFGHHSQHQQQLHQQLVGAPSKQTQCSTRLQELLLTCAAFYDEADFVHATSSAHWTLALSELLKNHAQCILVIDVFSEEFPIVYANIAAAKLTGHSVDWLLGKSVITVLQGEGTEPEQREYLRNSLLGCRPCKVAVTHYKQTSTNKSKKSKQPFCNLVATKPIFVRQPPPQKITTTTATNNATTSIATTTGSASATASPATPLAATTPGTGSDSTRTVAFGYGGESLDDGGDDGDDETNHFVARDNSATSIGDGYSDTPCSSNKTIVPPIVIDTVEPPSQQRLQQNQKQPMNRRQKAVRSSLLRSSFTNSFGFASTTCSSSSSSNDNSKTSSNTCGNTIAEINTKQRFAVCSMVDAESANAGAAVETVDELLTILSYLIASSSQQKMPSQSGSQHVKTSTPVTTTSTADRPDNSSRSRSDVRKPSWNSGFLMRKTRCSDSNKVVPCEL
mmetsp:Transcript_4683/g.7648  ORF Transcript_4683/g.7648 Transcript_4683/m.7648 type:complete len:721 (+) Transcript_4683:120-2282(+)